MDLPSTSWTRRISGLAAALAVATAGLVPLLTASCASSGPAETAENRPASGSAPAAGMRATNLIISRGDMMRIDVAVPGRKYGSMEAVEPNGDVATPDGSFVPAAGLTLGQFRDRLLELYRSNPGYEGVSVDVFIQSSPYKVVRFSSREPAGNDEAATEQERRKKSWERDFWADFYEKKKEPAAPAATNQAVKTPAPTIYPRNFTSPITIWEAIRKDGGVPAGVNARNIGLLRQNLDRKTVDVSGPAGAPDGTNLVRSGDVIFLVPPGTPVGGIFE